jgi:hypothetical protein
MILGKKLAEKNSKRLKNDYLLLKENYKKLAPKSNSCPNPMAL